MDTIYIKTASRKKYKEALGNFRTGGFFSIYLVHLDCIEKECYRAEHSASSRGCLGGRNILWGLKPNLWPQSLCINTTTPTHINTHVSLFSSFQSTCQRGRMIPEEFEKRVLKDKAEGSLPFFVNCTAGTTVFGAFDPIDAIAGRFWVERRIDDDDEGGKIPRGG